MKKHSFAFDESVIPTRFNSASERTMLQGFREVADQVMSEQDSYRRNGSTFLAGIELELPLVNKDFTLAKQSGRDAVLSAIPNTSVELAAHQLEVTPAAPTDLKKDLFSLENAMKASVSQVRAKVRQLGLQWVRIGSFPLCHIKEVDYTKGEPKYIKYQRSPSWHQAHQRKNAEGYILTREGPLDVRNAYIVGLINAVQITVDATSFADAIDKVNRSYMISPMAVALAANSSHLGYLYTNYADARFVVWEISHDTRTMAEVKSGFPTRVGLPQRYFTDMNSYFNQVLSYPFVMNDPISMSHPFEVGNGIYWRDARIKFFRDAQKVGVEFRPVGLQPSLYEDVAVMLFYVGRLLWSQHNKEKLLSMDLVKKNKEFAMSRGMQSKLYTIHNGSVKLLPAKEAMLIEIGRADKGLELLGASKEKRAHYMELWQNRVAKGSPAERFIRAAGMRSQTGFADARKNLIAAMEELHLVER